MHGEREYVSVSSKDCRRSVALMDIEIDHGCTPEATFLLEHADGHRNVIEYAKTLATIGKSMVSPTGEVTRQAILQRSSGRHESPLRGQARASPQGGRPWHA